MKDRVNSERSVVASLIGQSQDAVVLSAGFKVTGTVRGAKAEKGVLTNAVSACPSEWDGIQFERCMETIHRSTMTLPKVGLVILLQQKLTTEARKLRRLICA